MEKSLRIDACLQKLGEILASLVRKTLAGVISKLLFINTSRWKFEKIDYGYTSSKCVLGYGRISGQYLFSVIFYLCSQYSFELNSGCG